MQHPRLGVIVVAFNSADVILDCLESLLASEDVALDIRVVDNASSDNTLAVLENWACGEAAYSVPTDMPFTLSPVPKPVSLQGEAGADGHRITLIRGEVNGGFAHGVNIGLAALAAEEGIDRFWILNPDSVVPADSARAFATAPDGFALLGGRVLYYDTPEIIQIDGGLLNRRTGVTGNSGLGQRTDVTPAPDPAHLDFITGASMVASRAFYEAAGPMAEDYFLYYEEVDWALRRGDMPLRYCPGGIVYHKAGTAIGSPTLGRPASAFSQYFKHRGRMRFVRRWLPSARPGAIAYSFAKAAQLAAKGFLPEARAILAGTFDSKPPAGVRARLSKEAAQKAFDRSHYASSGDSQPE